MLEPRVACAKPKRLKLSLDKNTLPQTQEIPHAQRQSCTSISNAIAVHLQTPNTTATSNFTSNHCKTLAHCLGKSAEPILLGRQLAVWNNMLNPTSACQQCTPKKFELCDKTLEQQTTPAALPTTKAKSSNLVTNAIPLQCVLSKPIANWVQALTCQCHCQCRRQRQRQHINVNVNTSMSTSTSTSTRQKIKRQIAMHLRTERYGQTTLTMIASSLRQTELIKLETPKS